MILKLILKVAYEIEEKEKAPTIKMSALLISFYL